jgi:carboxymethylenebutenolidase
VSEAPDDRRRLNVIVDDGTFGVFVAQPKDVPAAAVICVPSIFGLNSETDRWLRDYADAGFLACVYDPFWRTDPGGLSVVGDTDRARAKTRRDAFVADDGIRDLTGVIAAMRTLPACNGNVAVAGYCFGGRYAMIAAARLDVQAAVAFHGIRMGDNLEDARSMKVPVSFHFGDEDHSTPITEVNAIIEAAKDDADAEIVVYPGVGHSFTWHAHKWYDRNADETSFRRALALLEPLNRKGNA